MRPEAILDITALELTKIVADRAAIREVNPHRFEMEMVDAVVLIDPAAHIVAGYKDVRDDEFWCRGHMPGFPIFPGVLMCEASAQLVSYYIAHVGLKQGDFIAFGGMGNVRFRGAVRPGDRFVIVGKGIKVDRRRSEFTLQGYVNNKLVFQGDIIGVQFTIAAAKAAPAAEA